VAVPRFKVTYKDGKELEVRVSPKAQVMFERHFKQTMSSFGKDPGAEHLCYLTWAGLHCAGMEGEDYETFLDKLADVDPVDASGEEADPTQTAPGPEPSSS
jgi:hypothetical protein